jgi:integrase
VSKQNRLMSKSSSAVLPIRERLTVAQWLERYANDHGQNRSPRTREMYRSYIRHINPALGHIGLMKLTPIPVRVFMSGLLDKGLAPSSRQHIFDFLNASLKDALKLDLLERNPMDAVERPRGGNVRPRGAWTPEEVKKMLEAAKGHGVEYLIHVCMTLGLRIGEAIALRWSDLEGDVLTISNTVNRAKDGGTFRPPKADSGGVIVLDVATIAVLERQRDKQAVQREKLLEAGLWQEHDLIFASEVGTVMSPRNVARALDVVIAKAGVRRFSSHAMRRTYTTLAAAYLPPRDIQNRLRHSDVRMTLDVYTQVQDSRKRSSALSLDTLLTPSDTPQSGNR